MSHEQSRILIVDDDPVTCELLCEVFERQGFASSFEQSGEAALLALQQFRPDVVLSDIRMRSRHDGLTLLDQVKREYPSTPVILMTAFGSVETAIRAVKEGAFDYISKPFRMDNVVATVRRALAVCSPREADEGVEDADDNDFASSLVGRDPAMLEVYKMIGRVADARAAILITGESGTGKELIARAIHQHGSRHHEPFVAINCGALTETLLESELFGHVKGSFTGAIANKAGIFEQAGEGTVFLDEISETSPALQVKLLRVLQEREVVPVGGTVPVQVRARVIAASNNDLDKLCLDGSFRRDLYYRLNVINIHVPPLRERPDDIPLLVTHFLRKHSAEGQSPPLIDDDALRALSSYNWPGNVRELENVVERAITLNQGGHITIEDIPRNVLDNSPTSDSYAPTPTLTTEAASPEVASEMPTIDEVERQHLLRVLEATGGNRKRAAEILGINRRTLYRMAARYGIDL